MSKNYNKDSLTVDSANTYKIIVLGLGGQGILFTGKVISTSAFIENYKANFLPTYGPEVQNGPVKAEIVISTTQIYNPFIDKADYILLFHKHRVNEAKNLIKENGMVFCKDFSTDLIPAKQIIKVDTETITENLKSPKISNLVMIGAFSGYTGILDDKSVGESLKQLLSHKQYNLATLNFKAYKQGKEIFKVSEQVNV